MPCARKKKPGSPQKSRVRTHHVIPPNPTKTTEIPARAQSNEAVLCVGYSMAFRRGLLDYHLIYNLLPTDFFLAQLLCLETLDVGITRGIIRLDAWAALLGYREGKGLRPDKCAKSLKRLVEFGIVDLNAAQATFELRPDSVNWSRLRDERRAVQTAAEGGELPLRCERLLDEALSSNSREKSLRGGTDHDRPSPFASWRQWIDSGARPQDMPEELRGPLKPAEPTASFGPSSEKSADRFGVDPRGKSSANFADVRQNPPKVSADKSADGVGEISRSSADKSADAKKPVNIGFLAPTLNSTEVVSLGGLGGAAAAAAVLPTSSVPQKEQQQGTPETVPVQGASADLSAEKKAAAAFFGEKNEGNKAAAAAAAPLSDKSADALAWLASVDFKRRLEDPIAGPQWLDLCRRCPNYVLGRLKSKLEISEGKGNRVNDPLSWLSFKARDDGKMKR